jgi:hypothetical protein
VTVVYRKRAIQEAENVISSGGIVPAASIGAENEVKGTKIFKANTKTSKLVKFQYDEEIATSRVMVPGFAIPHVTLATEDPQGKDHSIIEHCCVTQGKRCLVQDSEEVSGLWMEFSYRRMIPTQ